MKTLSIILISILLLSCKIQQPVTEVPIQYKEKIIERLVPVEIPADSALIQALFDCDSTNKVVMRELNDVKSRGQSATSFQDGKLTYKYILQHDTIYIPSDSVIIEREIPVKVPVEVKVNHLTQWQIFQIWLGRIFIVVVFICVVKKYGKTALLIVTRLIKIQ